MLIKTMESYGIPDKLFKRIKNFYDRPAFSVDVEGVTSTKHVQSSRIRQGCPLSPYLFLLVMSRVFEQGKDLKNEVSHLITGGIFDHVEMTNVDFSEILFVDNTLLFAAQGGSIEHLLWTVEEVSVAYGLRLNRTKCAAVSLQHVGEIVFSNGEVMPQQE